MWKVKQMYNIRIYDEYKKYGDYTEEVTFIENDEKDKDCLIVNITTETFERMISLWNKLLDTYEGFTYCIREDFKTLMYGVYDTGDIDYLKDMKGQ